MIVTFRPPPSMWQSRTARECFSTHDTYYARSESSNLIRSSSSGINHSNLQE